MRRTALWRVLVLGMVVALSLTAAACGGGSQGNSSNGGEPAVSSLKGAGASFPDPVYQRMFQAYNEKTGVQVNYDPVGSGGGREQFISNTVDFAGSDAPMSKQEQQKAGGKPVHVPTVGGAVVTAYNVPGISKNADLKLTGPVIAQIFLGNVTKWNDPAIKQLNPNVQLPNADITVVHRSDGSGTTDIFTTYLSGVSQAWANGPGASDEIDWPTGVGGDGNDGVTAQVEQTKNSIGYIGLEYAASGKGGGLPYASVANSASGQFVKPSVQTARNAINAVVGQLPPTLDKVLTTYTPQAQGQNVYPITSVTWLLVQTQMDDLATCKGVANLAHYMVTDGQKYAEPNNYVPLPDSLAQKSQGQIEKMQASGKQCYTGGGTMMGGGTTSGG